MTEAQRVVHLLSRIPVRTKRLVWRREFSTPPPEVSRAKFHAWRRSGKHFFAQCWWGNCRPRVDFNVRDMLRIGYDTDQLARVLVHEVVHAALRTHRAHRKAEHLWEQSPAIRRAARRRIALILGRQWR
jgi:hypothetical protein